MVAELVFLPRITCEDANHPQPAAMAMSIQQQQLPQGDYATMAAAMTQPRMSKEEVASAKLRCQARPRALNARSLKRRSLWQAEVTLR